MRPDGTIDAGVVNRVLAFRVYRHLAKKEPKNFVFSPLALGLTLAKLMRALDRLAARRIAHALCLSEPPPPSFETGLESEITRWKGLHSKGIDLTFETRAFGTVLPAALQGFESDSVDPTTAPGKSRVQQWMRAVTGARVSAPSLSSPTTLGAAVTFEGDWRIPFWRGRHTVVFYLDSGATANVPSYVNGRTSVRITDTRGSAALSEAVTLPYITGDLSLFVARPLTILNQRDGVPLKNLHELEERLTPEQLCAWDATLTRTGQAWVMIPKFSIHSAIDLSCCGLEWLTPRVGSLIQVSTLRTRVKVIPGPKVFRLEDDTFLDVFLVRSFLLMVRSPELILLMGRLSDPR